MYKDKRGQVMLSTDYKYISVVPEEYNHCLKRATSELYQTDSNESLKKFDEELSALISKLRQDFIELHCTPRIDEKIRVDMKFKISIEKDTK